MQYRAPVCQPDPARTGGVSGISTLTEGADTPTLPDTFEPMFGYSAGRVAVVRGAGQEIEHTASRRSGPRRWLRAVAELIAEGLHPRAGATTLRVAEDLAARMDFDTGHVRYCLTETAARLRIDPATVKRHVAVLRELGALAWAVRGTKANIRRLLGLPGYAATATVYAAVIPPVYDAAHGHQVLGTGYDARIVVRCAAVEAVDNSPSDAGHAPPSLSLVEEEGKAEVESGFTDTSRERASRRTASASPSSKRSSKGRGSSRRSAAQVARDCVIAARVRPLVNWTQSEGIRRLAFSLRPLIDQGLGAHDIAAELHAWMMLWRPEHPAAYIRARLAGHAVLDAARTATAAPADNPEMRAWLDEREQQAAVLEAMFAAAGERTDADRREARTAGAVDLRLVQDHLDDHGPDDTIDLYGARLASLAGRLAASGASVSARW